MYKYLFTLIGLLFVACSTDSPTDSNHDAELFESDDHPGFVFVKADGSSATLGTNKTEAKANEQHQMKVEFSYNFYIGKHEITCGEFLEFADNDTLKKSIQVNCNDNDNPIVNVTYYDAVLFANKLSKKEFYDTAYTYTATNFDSEGHCIGLEGFAFLSPKNAYRLPTEAEWTLVAKKEWNVSNAWTSKNSEFTIHKVCTKQAKNAQTCDMIGNVMEWANDWLGFFVDTTLVNFIGAADGGGIDERVIKGGSFKNDPQNIQIYNRGDVYTVTSATKANYVGFRLAFGSIPDPTWISRNGQAVDNHTNLLVSSTKIQSLTGAKKTKLVFRNDETGLLNFINFQDASPTVAVLNDSIEAYHPDISPNGEYVAFCTGVEGISNNSSLYVQRLDAKENFIIKLDVSSAAIPRWHISTSGDTSIVYVSRATNNTDSSEFLTESTWQVPFSKGKFGTPQKLTNGNYHGGISKDNQLAVTGARLLRARIAPSQGKISDENAIDTVWFNGEQACNVSLSKDPSKRILFLDFGSETGAKFVGKKYDVHERLLIADSTGKLVQSIAAPSGYSFDHSEWVISGTEGKSELIIASLANADGAHQKIVLVNTADSSITDLISGNELWHPALWSKSIPETGSTSVLDYDSAGIYYTSESQFAAYELRKKMEAFWTNRKSYTAVSFGSSRMLFGVDSREIKNEKLLNFGYSGGDLYGIPFLFENYVLNHMPNVKYVVMELTPNMLWRRVTNDWKSIYENAPGYQYDESHDFWKDSIPDNFIDVVADGPTMTNTSSLPYRDEFTLPSRSWGSSACETNTSGMFFEDDSVQANFARFKAVVEKANAANIKVIALIFPVHPGFKQTGTFGVWGPNNLVAEQIINAVAGLDIYIMDENKWGDHDYTNEMAYDNDHLSYLGAKQLSVRLDSLFQTLE